ncbi:Cupredoxin [Vararia minispora EC-137]|uniref:Cupredoxin n=1 Tax=Vararia minispora EC-137 TaxID=1314806 RepID=A0ACB8QNQ4_9AGAM|nr:Cupredoxin [Vararia minispora EC-137]
MALLGTPAATASAIAPAVSAYVLNSSFTITDTPATRSFDWVVAAQTGTPDGYNRTLITINNQMPGPLIEANEGDTIIVTVRNSLVNQTMSIHWHGIYQNGSAWMDGVPGVTQATLQCPIQPGQTFTYEFQVNQYGTYWYHSHSAVQYTDGLLGPLIIHSVDDPLVRGTDFEEERVLFFQDWYHDEASTIVNKLLSVDGYEGSAAAPSPQSGLINGVGVYNCSAVTDGTACTMMSYPELNITPNVKTRFRIINGGSHAQFYFSVDNHTLDVVEADSTAISGPSAVHRVPFHNGQRYSVILDASVGSEGDAYWLRAKMNTNCFATIDDTLNSTVFAIVRYGASSGSDPTTSDWTDVLPDDCTDLDDSVLIPAVESDPPSTAAGIAIFDSVFGTITYNGVSFNRFLINETTYTNYIYQPFLNQVNAGNSTLNNSNVAWATLNDGVYGADIVINNLDPGLDHPYHLHGQDFWIVARGDGQLTYDAAQTLSYNLSNPIHRDTLVIPARRVSYAVLRINNDNPGVWVLHCHIAWHLAEGFLGVVVSNPSAIGSMTIPTAVTDLCSERPAGVSIYETEPGRRRRDVVGLVKGSHARRGLRTEQKRHPL